MGAAKQSSAAPARFLSYIGPHIMADHEASRSSTTDGLPLAPSLGPALESAHVEPHSTGVDRRTVVLSGICIVLAAAAAGVAQLLTRLIGLITNLAYYGHFSTRFVSPAEHHLGALAIAVPVVG